MIIHSNFKFHFFHILLMAKVRPPWFWALIIILIMIWTLGGTQAVLYILDGELILGEIMSIWHPISFVLIIFGVYLVNRNT